MGPSFTIQVNMNNKTKIKNRDVLIKHKEMILVLFMYEMYAVLS